MPDGTAVAKVIQCPSVEALCEPQAQSARCALAACSLARLEAEIEQFFATATREEIETLLKKANFDHYNKIGTDILPPREAPENVRDEPRHEYDHDQTKTRP